jgi:signal transduction histidine kinase
MLRLRAFRVRLAPTRRIAVACLTLGLLLAGASWVAFRSDANSRDMSAEARHESQQALTAERAISEFWRERESIGEYLVLPSPALANEVQDRRQAFEVLAFHGLEPATDPHTRRERALLTRTVRANATLVAIATGPQLDRSGATADRDRLQKLVHAEASVLTPLRAVYQLNQSAYLRLEARARASARTTLRIELASALLALAGIGWFAVFATGLVKRVDSQNAALRSADELKDEFINTVSHELRTPITSIQGYLELLLDTEDGGAPLTDEQRSFLQTVTRSSDRLLHLVNDLLLVAQARAGRLEMNKQPCDLVGIARQAVEAAHASAAKSGIALTLRPLVKQAVVRLGQAIDNLISNAIKFTPDAGTIGVEVSQIDDRALITITDTGIGMSDAEVGQLFERFFRTRSAKEGNIQGTGLGLTITKSIVEAHGGTIDVASEPGAGTVFTITLAGGSSSVGPRPAPAHKGRLGLKGL